MRNISLFKDFTKEIGIRNLVQITEGIRGDHYKEPILKIRELVDLGDQEKVDRLKKALVAFTVSGLFEGRSQIPRLLRHRGRGTRFEPGDSSTGLAFADGSLHPIRSSTSLDDLQCRPN